MIQKQKTEFSDHNRGNPFAPAADPGPFGGGGGVNVGNRGRPGRQRMSVTNEWPPPLSQQRNNTAAVVKKVAPEISPSEKHCPVCDEDIQHISNSKFIQKCIQKLLVACPYTNKLSYTSAHLVFLLTVNPK